MKNVKSMKSIGVFLIIMMVAIIATACGTSANKDQNGSKGNSSPSTNVSSSPSPEASNAPALSGTVTASGSTALMPLVNQAAEEFMTAHPKVTVNVTGGGSGTGIKNVADGVSDIGNSDVEAGEEYKGQLVDHVVAVAPFALVVHADVNVDNVTMQQAADIYAGKITNWKEVGGQDLAIVLIHRQDSSGSRKLVSSIVMKGEEFSKEGVTQDSSKTVVEAVTNTAGAIGYVDTPYITDKVKALQLDGVAFSKEAIKDGSYPLYGVEHMYTKGEATGVVKEFLDFILSAEFQGNQVEALKFLPADLLSK